MKDKYYYMLIEHFDAKDEVERLKILNDRINEILINNVDPQQTMEALLCSFEGKSNISLSLSVLAIAYTVCIGAVTIIATEIDKVFWGNVLVIVAVVLVVIAFLMLRREEKRAFVFRALTIRYEKMKNSFTDINSLENMSNNNKTYKYIVEVKKK